MGLTVVLGLVAVAFAYSLGAHYTGACMGMPHALGAVSARRALLIMAPLALLGATFASHAVEHTVGATLSTRGLTVADQVAVVGVAFGLTSAFNRPRIPTSTIQILVLTVAGVALGTDAGVRWGRIGLLGLVWVSAPLAACLLGFVLTRTIDLIGSFSGAPARSGSPGPPAGAASARLGVALVVVGMAASFAMGANDVANATGSLVGTGTLGPLTAGLLGGAGIAAGVITWGRPLLERVAFEIVSLDRAMATAAQLVQAAVVLVAVSFGLFTSMNQALVGAMVGAGQARGRHTVQTATLRAIVRGWFIGPGAGLVAGYISGRAISALGVR